MAPFQTQNLPPAGTVLDIGGSDMSTDILTRLRAALLSHDTSPSSNPTLPDELLYDDNGLAIWADIIFTPEFYQTRDEIALFERNSVEIAENVPEGSVMVDLGAGDLRKVERLLAELECRGDRTTYLALDISQASLSTNIKMLAPLHTNVTCAGLWGDFNAGLDWVSAVLDPEAPRVFLSLGSVLFNDAWPTAVASLKKWAALMQPQDRILAGMDGHSIGDHRDKVWAAYHSRGDLFDRFWANGFAHANRLLGEEWLRPEDWDTCAELDEGEGRHRFFFRAKRDVVLGDTGKVLGEGQELEWFDAHKHGEKAVKKMCDEAELVIVKSWKAPGSEMAQYLLRLKDREISPNDVDRVIGGML